MDMVRGQAGYISSKGVLPPCIFTQDCNDNSTQFDRAHYCFDSSRPDSLVGISDVMGGRNFVAYASYPCFLMGYRKSC